MTPIENYDLKPERSIRRRVLRNLAIALYRHPFLAIALLLALSWAAVESLRRMEVKEDLRALMPRGAEDERAWQSISLVAPRYDPITVEIRFTSPTLPASERRAEVAHLFSDALDDRRYFSAVEEFRIAKASPPQATLDKLLENLRPEDLALLDTLATSESARRALEKAVEDAGTSPSATPPDGSTQGGGITPTDALDPADPLGVLRTAADRRGPPSGPFPPALAQTSPAEPDAQTIVLRLAPIQPPSKLVFCTEAYGFLTDTVEVLRARAARDLTDLEVRFYGRHVETARRVALLRTDLLRLTATLILSTGLLTILAYRKVEALLFLGLPPLMGLLWTYGLACAVTTDLNLLTAVFPFLLVALGMEFTVQIYNRFIEELYRERRYYPALGTAYTEAGRGVVVSTILVAGVFLSLYLSAFNNLRELAVVCGLGIVAMALAPLLLLPPMAALKSRLARGRVSPVKTYDFGLHSLSAAIIASPRTTLTLGLAITAYFAFFTREIQLNRNIGLDLAAPHERDASRGPLALGGNATIEILVEGATLQEALARNDRLYAKFCALEPRLRPGAIYSISPMLASIAQQTRTQDLIQRLDLPAIEPALRSAAGSIGLESSAFEPFVETLRALQARSRAAQRKVKRLADIGDAAQIETIQRHVTRDSDACRILTTIVPSPASSATLTGRFDALRSALESDGSKDPSLRFYSEPLQNRRVAMNVIPTVALTVLLSALWLFACILPHFHWRLVDASLALVPLACAAIWTFGFLAYFQVRIGLYALLTFPLVMGIALDQAVVFIQRLRERRYATLRQVTRAGGRAGIVAGLTLVLGFGCLVQAPFQALQEAAGMALLAVAFSTLATLTLVPALLQIRQEGGLTAWLASGRDEA